MPSYLSAVSPFVSQPLSQGLGLSLTYGLAGGLMLLLALLTLGFNALWDAQS